MRKKNGTRVCEHSNFHSKVYFKRRNILAMYYGINWKWAIDSSLDWSCNIRQIPWKWLNRRTDQKRNDIFKVCFFNYTFVFEWAHWRMFINQVCAALTNIEYIPHTFICLKMRQNTSVSTRHIDIDTNSAHINKYIQKQPRVPSVCRWLLNSRLAGNNNCSG